MPWCEACSKYLAPTAMTAAGNCPVCDSPVGEAEAKASEIAASESAPWHFKVLIVVLVIYLGWRFVQLLA